MCFIFKTKRTWVCVWAYVYDTFLETCCMQYCYALDKFWRCVTSENVQFWAHMMSNTNIEMPIFITLPWILSIIINISIWATVCFYLWLIFRVCMICIYKMPLYYCIFSTFEWDMSSFYWVHRLIKLHVIGARRIINVFIIRCRWRLRFKNNSLHIPLCSKILYAILSPCDMNRKQHYSDIFVYNYTFYFTSIFDWKKLVIYK